MTDYYVDGAGSNTSPYDTWAKAATSFQTVADLLDAGDTAFCRGTETLGAIVDIDNNLGTAASFIKVIGCNGSGDIDGTRFTLDGDGTAANCMKIAAAKGSYWYFENIEFTGATSHGVSFASGTGGPRTWVNCGFNVNTGNGIYMYYGTSGKVELFIRCQANGNTATGFDTPFYSAQYLLCEANNNGGNGFEGTSATAPSTVYGCIGHNNTSHGFVGTISSVMFANNVFDENGLSGINYSGSAQAYSVCIGNRLTGNGTGGTGYGIDCAGTSFIMYGWNFLLNNDAATNGDCYVIPYDDDTDTNETSGTEGYTDGANEDFNLTSSATLRSEPIELD